MSVLLPNPAPPAPIRVEGTRLIGDPEIDREVEVLVGGRVAFRFRRRDDGDWEELGAVTAGRGFPVNEAWLSAARELARKVLREAIGDGVDTVRCPECGKLLCSPLLARDPAKFQRGGVTCSPSGHDVLLLSREGYAWRELVRFDATGRASALPEAAWPPLASER